MTERASLNLPNTSRREFLHQSSLALIGLAGVGFPGVTRAGRGKALHIRNYMDVSSLDPVSSVSAAEGLIGGAIFQNLLQFSAGRNWGTQPDAAETVEQTSATRYFFRLKPGQMFTNGYGEMTADDVKWIVLLVLLNQPGQENAFALMEELVYNGEPVYLH